MEPPLSKMVALEISLLLHAFTFLGYVCQTLEMVFVGQTLSIHIPVEFTLERGNSDPLLKVMVANSLTSILAGIKPLQGREPMLWLLNSVLKELMLH